ncbi:hypothetical protein [Prosthecobacter sp.]|jgi:hypothetical protein|uniref:hypothetical protein n=1 Tax=Prosthecobacter sp. TaxID=1965333 RepID=UPI0037840178
MLEFRLGSLLLKLLLFLALALGGYEYFIRMDELKAEIAKKKNQIQELQETANARSAEYQELARVKSQISDLLKRETVALQQRDMIDQKERRLTGEIKYLSQTIPTVVEKARAAAIGTTIKVLKLESRSALLNAKIMRIEDNSVTFMHEEGVANFKVYTEELPRDFTDKYDLGPKSISKGLELLSDELSAAQQER